RGAPEAVRGARRERLLLEDLREELLRRRVQLARRLSLLRVLEDLREFPGQLPRGEEERPVDVAGDLVERRLVHAGASERGGGEVLRAPLDRRPLRARFGDAHEWLALLVRVELAQLVLLGAVLRVERGLLLGIEERRDDVDRARRVEHVN